MTDHPSDDFDEMLHDVARDYNRPSDVPRERMWSAIQTARARRPHTPVAPWRTRRVWLVPAAAAAVLLIGIAIGRAYEHWSAAPNARAVATTKPDSVATPTQAPVKEPPRRSIGSVVSPGTEPSRASRPKCATWPTSC